MKDKRWAWLLSLLALPLLALACGDDGGDSMPPVVTDEELTAAEELLASMSLTAEEVGGVFPGIAWAVGESHPTFGLGGFIPDDQRAVGLVAAWIAVLGPGGEEGVSESGDEVVTTDLFLYEIADNASVALQDELERLNREGAEIDRFDAGEIGDEAQSAVTRNPGGRLGTGVFMRVDRILAFIRVLRSDDEDMSEEARQLAQELAEKIEANIQG